MKITETNGELSKLHTEQIDNSGREESRCSRKWITDKKKSKNLWNDIVSRNYEGDSR